MMSSERKWELYRGGVILGVVTCAPDEGDFPWLIGYLAPMPEYENVRNLFEREDEAMNRAMESGSEEDQHAADELLMEILAPGIRFKELSGGKWWEANGIS